VHPDEEGDAVNGCERIQAALQNRQPDTTPVMLHNFMMAAREAGITMATFRSDPKELARAFIESMERYGYDGILIDVDTVTLAAAAGVPVDLPVDEPGRVLGGRLRRLEEAHDLKPVDILQHRGVEVWLEAVRLLKRHFGDEVCIRGNCDQSPFTLASLVRGMDAWMVDLLDPEMVEHVHALLAYAADITTQFVRHMAATGAHMCSNGNSVAGPELISPSLYRRFALPYDRQVATASHAAGLPYVLHICGNTGAILDDMIATGADGLEIDYKTDPHIAHEKLRHRTVFVGNIDPSGVLALGSPALVEKKTLELLQIFADTPRFILNAGCAIPPATPPENLRAMIRIAREFRR
jgi:uroporphyrinogen decarboxylase